MRRRARSCAQKLQDQVLVKLKELLHLQEDEEEEEEEVARPFARREEIEEEKKKKKEEEDENINQTPNNTQKGGCIGA